MQTFPLEHLVFSDIFADRFQIIDYHVRCVQPFPLEHLVLIDIFADRFQIIDYHVTCVQPFILEHLIINSANESLALLQAHFLWRHIKLC